MPVQTVLDAVNVEKINIVIDYVLNASLSSRSLNYNILTSKTFLVSQLYQISLAGQQASNIQNQLTWMRVEIYADLVPPE